MRTSLSWPLACVLACWGLSTVPNAHAAEPLVIGQSLPNGVGSYRATVALKQGARAMVGRANDSGGVRGRPIKLVSLDGGNDPQAHADNVRRLVREHGAVAIIGCAGDGVCEATASAAAEMHVPMIGALSGSAAMSRDANRWVFTIRPGYEREAQALAVQLQSLGITRIALLTDAGAQGPKALALRKATETLGIRTRLLELRPGDEDSLQQTMARIADGGFQAVIADVVPDTVDAMAAVLQDRRTGWPSIVLSLASSSLQGLSNLFPDRAIGFSQIAPNPDADSMPLTTELQRSVERYSAGTAINFDGMAAYIATKVAVEGLRRAGAKADGAALAAALEGLDGLDLGGYLVSFAAGRKTGSDWVRIGMRSRNGTYLK